MEDDVYRGMHIPKGSLVSSYPRPGMSVQLVDGVVVVPCCQVFGNIWAMMHDERIFTDADKFNPERFLENVDTETERKRDPRNYVFGFGRRYVV